MSFNEKNIDSSIIIEVSGDVDLDKTDDFRNQVLKHLIKNIKWCLICLKYHTLIAQEFRF